MIRLLFVSVFAFAACDQSPNPLSAQVLPEPVDAAIKALAAQCRAGAGIPYADKAVRRGDFNADGREDFVLYAGWMMCENAASVFGDREKDVAVFVSNGAGGVTQAFADSVYDVMVENKSGRNQLWLTVSAGQCGKARAPTFSEESFCERSIAWNATSSRFEFEPVSAIRMPQQ